MLNYSIVTPDLVKLIIIFINRGEFAIDTLDKNMTMIQEIFQNDDTLMIQRFQNQYDSSIKCCIFYIEGMVDNDLINDNIILPVIKGIIVPDDLSMIDHLIQSIIPSINSGKSLDRITLVDSIIDGDTVLFLDGFEEGIIIQSNGMKTRQIEEPDVERSLRGPREGFTESLPVNLSLIRRRLQTKDLKFKYLTIGERTNTKVCICYLEGLADENILPTLYDQLNSISIDGVLSVKYIQEYIDINPFSLFETTSSTEKPDVVVAKLLEGRIAIIADGTPVVMTLPCLFIEAFQSADDYYLNYYFASINRIIRILGFLATISTPALYLSLVAFHPEMIPTPLIMSIYASRLGVPLPTVLELVGLLLVFEILREAGTRMPAYVGQALSIVGALVLGTAAVDAKFVSAPIVIVVGLSGITSLMTPSITGAAIIIKIGLIALSSILGLYGYVMGMAFLLIHLLKLRSFGVPFMGNLTSLKPQDLKDTAIRSPRWYMRYRPKFIGDKNPIRSTGGKNHE